MRAAIGDAAWMTEMERNSDLVIMHCYAPLLVNVSPGARQWRPNLIGYDALRVYGSPSYHAIKLFATHVGDEILKASATDTDVLVSVTRDSRSRTLYVKLVNPGNAAAPGAAGHHRRRASTHGDGADPRRRSAGHELDRRSRARGAGDVTGHRREIGFHLHRAGERHRRAEARNAVVDPLRVLSFPCLTVAERRARLAKMSYKNYPHMSKLG